MVLVGSFVMYRYRKTWPERHPLLLGLSVLFGVFFVAALWWLFLAVAVLAAIGACVVGICVGVLCLARCAEREHLRRAELAAHADYENAMLLRGDWYHGTFGQYPPYSL